MSRRFRLAAALPAVLVVAHMLHAAAAAELPSPGDAAVDPVGGGKLLFSLRPRFEYVDQDGKPDRAEAFTMRTLLGWQTLEYHGFSALIQAIDVSRLAPKDYNDAAGRAATSPYPLVPDPHTTDLNQAYVDWTGLADTTVRAGRQSIKLDNVRFVGNVEFRQIMQVFHGVTVENKSLPNTDLYGGFLGRVRTTVGTERGADIGILHAAYHLTPTETATAYGYFDNDPHLVSTAAKDLSNKIFGLRFDGAHPVDGAFGILYTAEYARQSSTANGDAKIDAGYVHVGAGPRWGDWSLRLDQERLGSNGGTYAFQMPLATNHPFQGWADQFLTTPAQGLRDTYVTIGGKVADVQLYSEYHKYKADFGSIDFGKELDASAAYKFAKGVTGKLEYADYREGDVLSPATARKRDTTKIWVTLLLEY